MAKNSVNVRDRKRRKLVAKYSAKRKELKANGDWEGLDKLPRNSSKIRVRNRCEITGRPHGVYRKLKISRIALRELTLAGKIPGMIKSSW